MNRINQQIRNLFLAVAVFAAGGMAISPAASAATVELPTTMGHIQTGGAFAFMHGAGTQFNTNDSGNWSLDVQPMVEYFLIDRLSIGASANLLWMKDGGSSSFSHSIAPSLTFYFLDLNPAELFFHQSVDFGWASSGVANNGKPTSWTSALGVSLFMNKNVAFAPEIEWHYGNDRTGYWDVAGTFQIFF